jgi:CelD/BcsL family acetyltransferase involved in cellulose biosynthesis
VDEAEPLIGLDPSFVAEEQVCHVADLRSVRQSGGTVLGALSSSTAAKIRRSMRRLEEAYGPIRVEWADSRAQAENIFEEMMALHLARWEAAGQTGTFASPRFAGFHRDIVDRLFPAGGIGLARVSAGDCTIGCDYGFIEHNRVLAYQWGVNQFEDRRLSPGLVTGAVVMQAAMERGLDEYDWLAGDVLYKRQLATTTRQLVWASAARGARIHFIYELARAKRLAQRLRPFRSIAGLIAP